MNSAVPDPTAIRGGSGASRFTSKRPSYPGRSGRHRGVTVFAPASTTLPAVARAAVVIPNWNGIRFLGDCLRSLVGQSHPARIIVVDNASTDGSPELVRARFPEVTLLSLP